MPDVGSLSPRLHPSERNSSPEALVTASLDTIGTRAETAAYQRMRLVLTGARRSLPNRLRRQGVGHDHTPATGHPERR